MFTSVLTVLYAKYSLTLSVGSSPASISLSESKYVKAECPWTDEREGGGGSCVEVVYDFVLSLTRAHPNTNKQSVAHCYPLRAPVKAVDR